jgi:flagellar basal body-associated protein FliL
MLLVVVCCSGCASKPAYSPNDCPTWEGLGPIQVNPAGARDRHLRMQAAFRVCPPVEGLAEIERKRIELRHEVIILLSSQTTTQLEDPLRVENLRVQMFDLANEKVMRKARVTDVFVTAMHLE